MPQQLGFQFDGERIPPNPSSLVTESPENMQRIKDLETLRKIESKEVTSFFEIQSFFVRILGDSIISKEKDPYTGEPDNGINLNESIAAAREVLTKGETPTHH